jgi:hypothetical protein
MWEKQSSDGSLHDMANTYTWDQAFSAHAATLNTMNFAGYNDWRVPNVKELESIANYQNVNPAVSPAFNDNCTPRCTVLTCSPSLALPQRVTVRKHPRSCHGPSRHPLARDFSG